VTSVFNYIEMFYNPQRRHGTAGGMNTAEMGKLKTLLDRACGSADRTAHG